MTEVVIPDEPPALTDRGWRALLAILTAQAEEQVGTDWRAHLTEPKVRGE